MHTTSGPKHTSSVSRFTGIRASLRIDDTPANRGFITSVRVGDWAFREGRGFNPLEFVHFPYDVAQDGYATIQETRASARGTPGVTPPWGLTNWKSARELRLGRISRGGSLRPPF